MTTTNHIDAYMIRQGFGDYSKADGETRSEMQDAALAYEAGIQAKRSIFADLGAERMMAAYEGGTATAADIRSLRGMGAISADDAAAYYEAHGWALPKYGIR